MLEYEFKRWNPDRFTGAELDEVVSAYSDGHWYRERNFKEIEACWIASLNDGPTTSIPSPLATST